MTIRQRLTRANIEVFQITQADADHAFKEFLQDAEVNLPADEAREIAAERGFLVWAGWYWWSCSPGCMPDGEASGPFETQAEAQTDALQDLP